MPHFLQVAVILSLVISTQAAAATEGSCLQISDLAFKLQDLPPGAKVHAGMTSFKSSRKIETAATARLVSQQLGVAGVIYSGPRARGPELSTEISPERGKKFTQDACETVTVVGGQQYFVDRSRSTPQTLALRAPKTGAEVTYTFTEGPSGKHLKIARALSLVVPEGVDCVPAQLLDTQWEVAWETDRSPMEASIHLKEIAKLSDTLDEGRSPASEKNLCERQREIDEKKKSKKGLPLTAPF